MTQRGRLRNAGLIDTVGDSINPALTIPWVTGRFYGGSVQVGALATATPGTSIYCVPILVPRPIIATSIGVESTSGSTAGGLLRIAIYDSDPVSCMPNLRRVDSGTIASDATGFLSAVISVMLYAGWHWLVGANFAGTTATLRTLGNGAASIGAFQRASSDTPNLVNCQGIRIANASNIVNVGFPYRFFSGSYGGNGIDLESTTTQYPNWLIGV